MPRIGHNPLVNDSLPPYPGIVLVMITHLPNRMGYHEQRLEVIQQSIETMRENAGRDLPLYIWDNGSDQGFKYWLVCNLKPDYLTLAPNVGKASARTATLRSFPSNTILCFSDDDILYQPNWLLPQLDLLYTFPNVGAVSGCPIRTQSRWGIDYTLDWATKEAELNVGRFIPEKWEYDYCMSIGRDFEEYLESSANDKDYLISYKGKRAYAMAHHMQFIGVAGRLSDLKMWPRQAMRAEQEFDIAVDNLMLLRLTTTERYTTHMGNRLE
jgi:hypothetical protein